MRLGQVLSRQYSDRSVHGTPRALAWIHSPLEKSSTFRSESESKPALTPSDETPQDESQVLNFANALPDERPHQVKLLEGQLKHLHDDDNPHFRAHHEASSIELFYDLFFVANLATFTSNHPIDDVESLASYMGFFTLLWFTWFQTSLYDARFSVDSVFSRVCKALHFGIMTGFAIVGPLFVTNEEERDSRAFRSLSLVLMVSRLVLAVQYGTVLWFARGYKRTILPLALVIGTLLVTAVIFLGLTFAFGPDRGRHAHDGWYVTVVAEAVLILAVSSQWRILSFKHTHLVERVGLLTLIIMGEGIIGMTKSITNIIQGLDGITGSSIGLVVCAILIIYFLYMLYYDQIDHDRFGTIRQQIWAVLHFPLHVAMLLTVEGSSEFIVWRIGIELINWTNDTAFKQVKDVDSSPELVKALNATFQEVSARFSRLPPLDFSGELKKLAGLNFTADSDEETSDAVGEIVQDMLTETYDWIFENLGIEAPEKVAETATTGEERLDAIGDVFTTVFIYFFVAAGCTLIVLSVMYLFGKTNKARTELLSAAYRLIIGIGLALIPLIIFSPDSNYFATFIFSPWILPTVTLSYGFVIMLDNVLNWVGIRRVRNDVLDYTLTEEPVREIP